MTRIKADQPPLWPIGLSNATDADMVIWLEPWCDEFVLPARGELGLRIESDDEGLAPEFEFTESGLTIYGAGGALMRVWVNGVEQDTGSAEIVFPKTPFGIRGFVDMVFGDFPEARPRGAPAPDTPDS